MAEPRRRREELIEAGVALLAEAGWAAVTHRGVAARAAVNPGLVHYYFQGTPGLRRAVAKCGVARAITAPAEALLAAEDEDDLRGRAAAGLAAVRDDPRTARLTAELAGAAFGDPEIAALVRDALAAARARVRDWLAARHPGRPPAWARDRAAALVAAFDGLTLHALIDPDLPVTGPVRALFDQEAAHGDA